MPRPTKFYDVLVDGHQVFHGSFSEAKKAYLAVRNALSVLKSNAVVTMSFVPDFVDGSGIFL